MSVDEVLVEEVLDQKPVHPHLFRPVPVVHKVIADMMHPCVEVGADVSAEHVPCVETVVATEPWKPVVSATASGPILSVRITGLLTAYQPSWELALKVFLVVVHPALLVVTREHSVAACQIMELAGQLVYLVWRALAVDGIIHVGMAALCRRHRGLRSPAGVRIAPATY